MYFLTVAQLIGLHDRIIDLSGNIRGIRYQGTIVECAEKPRIVIFDYEPYRGIFEKAAALMHCIIYFKPFIDGNKRTGIAAAMSFLEMNGIILEVDVREGVKYTLKIANGEVNIDQITDWLKKHSRALTYEV